METHEDKKKKGWFSRKTTSPVNEKVSRPPTASSWTKSSVGTNEDELPPRMSSSSPPAGESDKTPTPSRPQTPSQENSVSSPAPVAKDSDPASQLPIHAGFDLKAIQEALRQAEANPDELKFRSKPYPGEVDGKKLPVPPSMGERAGSEPVGMPSVGVGLRVGLERRKTSLDERLKTKEGLEDAFEARSRIRDDDEHEEESSPASSSGKGLKASTPRLGSALPPFVEDDVIPSWSPVPGPSSTPSPLKTIATSPLGSSFSYSSSSSSTTLSSPLFGPSSSSSSSSSSMSYFSNPRSNASFASSPPPALSMAKGSIPAFSPTDGGFNYDPSVVSSPPLTARTTKAAVPPFSPIAGGGAAMSFGGMDGSIVTFGGADGSVTTNPDPWQVRPSAGKSSSGLGSGYGGSNPWS